MNERIKGLAQQTGILYNTRDDEYFTRFSDGVTRLDMEEFAKLLIRECVEVINAAKPGVNQLPAEVALDIVSKNVKAYFGIE